MFPSVASHCLKLERALHFPRGCCPPALMRSIWSFWKPTKEKWKKIHVKMGVCVVQVNLCGPFEIRSTNSWHQQYLIPCVIAHTALEEIKTSQRFFTLLRKYHAPLLSSSHSGAHQDSWWLPKMQMRSRSHLLGDSICEASLLSLQTAVKPWLPALTCHNSVHACKTPGESCD